MKTILWIFIELILEMRSGSNECRNKEHCFIYFFFFSVNISLIWRESKQKDNNYVINDFLSLCSNFENLLYHFYVFMFWSLENRPKMFYKCINILYIFIEKLKLIEIYFFYKEKEYLKIKHCKNIINNQTLSNYFRNPIYYDFI